jgi:hypothetical protein
MISVLRSIPTDAAAWHASASAANGFAPFAGVPPVGRQPVSDVDAGGTPYPLRSKGSEFNQLAPHAPEWLIAPRSAMSRQHRLPRAPPVLDSMARHG